MPAIIFLYLLYMKKTPGYIVRYNSGSYGDFFEHNVAVFTNKADAERCCLETDEKNLYQKSEISKENWEKIEYEYDELVWKDSNFDTKIPYDKPGGKEEHQRVLDYQESTFIDIIQKYYPKWSREKCKEEKEIYETMESNSYQDISKAYVEEIDLYL